MEKEEALLKLIDGSFALDEIKAICHEAWGDACSVGYALRDGTLDVDLVGVAIPEGSQFIKLVLARRSGWPLPDDPLNLAQDKYRCTNANRPQIMPS